jgi:hypothetical protein
VYQQEQHESNGDEEVKRARRIIFDKYAECSGDCWLFQIDIGMIGLSTLEACA